MKEGSDYFVVSQWGLYDIVHDNYKSDINPYEGIAVFIDHWKWDGYDHAVDDDEILGVWIKAQDNKSGEDIEFVFADKYEAHKAGFEFGDDEENQDDFDTKEEAENYAREKYPWLKKIEKK